MKSNRWQLQFAAALLVVATALYAVRFFAFSSPEFHNELWRFLVGDIAFLFLQVPLVTLVIDRVLQRRQREEMLNKLNMVIGAFFSEAGQSLLGSVAAADARLTEIRGELVPDVSWKAADYAAAKQAFRDHHPRIELTAPDLEVLRAQLEAERPFLINLLSNQNLLEHASFTDLLWALTHLGEELEAREDLSALAGPDSAHLAGDIRRAYTLLGVEWLAYLQHLQSQYPYLFSLAVRTNPLDPEARVTVVE